MAIARSAALAIAAHITCLAAHAAQPCARDDKACANKALDASVVKSYSYWQGPLSRPLAERIGLAPPEVVEYLQFDVIANGYPSKPGPSKPDPAFEADVRRAFEGIPASVKNLLEPVLGGIYIADDIGGTGFSDSTGDQSVGFIVLDPTVLRKQTPNKWATWKDSTPFRPDPRYRIETRIATDERDDRVHAIQYILLHEIGHVLSLRRNVHPRWDLAPAKAASLGRFPFFDRSWTVRDEQYASWFDKGFPQRRELKFYFGPKVDAREMRAIYDALEKTNFPTLYAATNPSDDWAESFASYVHVVMMGRDHEVRLYRDGKLEKTIGPCWGQARCATKRTALESALGLPVTR